jgi:hypothetical protein
MKRTARCRRIRRNMGRDIFITVLFTDSHDVDGKELGVTAYQKDKIR